MTAAECNRPDLRLLTAIGDDLLWPLSLPGRWDAPERVQAASFAGRPEWDAQRLYRRNLEHQLADLRALMRRYRDRPMSLADACLVRLAELHPGGTVFTLDGDFRVYRRHGNKVVPVLMPAI